MKQKYYTTLSYTKMQVIEWFLTYKTNVLPKHCTQQMKKSESKNLEKKNTQKSLKKCKHRNFQQK